MLEHLLAAFLYLKILLGVLAMHSYICAPVGNMISQVIMLAVLGMPSDIYETGGCIFPTKYFIVDVENTFSHLSVKWQNFF